MASTDVFVTFGGDTAGLEAALALAKVNVAATAAELRTLAREMQQAGSAATADLGSKMRVAAASLTEAKAAAAGLASQLRGTSTESIGHMAQLRETLQGLTSPLRAVRQNLGEIAEIFVAAFAVEKINAFVERLTAVNEETKKASLVLGMPMEAVSGLQAAAEAAGAAGDTVTRAFARMGVNLTNQSSQTKRAFDLLGLSFDQLAAKTPEARFEAIGQALMKVADPASRDAAANALFGRSFEALLPIFALGKDGLDEWKRTVEETGSSTERASAALTKTKDEMVTLGLAVRGDGIDAFLEFHGIVDSVYTVLSDLAVAFHSAMAEGGFVKDTINFIADALKALVSGVVATIAVFRSLWDTATNVADQIGIAWLHLGTELQLLFADLGKGFFGFFSGIGEAASATASAIGKEFSDADAIISDALHGDLAGARAGFGMLQTDASSSLDKIKSAMKSGFDFSDVNADQEAWVKDTEARNGEMFESLNKDGEDYKKELDSLWADPEKNKPTEDPSNKGRMAPAGSGRHKKDNSAKDAMEEETGGIDRQISAVRAGAKANQSTYEEELKTKQISEAQKVALTEASINAEYAAELGLLNKELAIGGISVSQRQEILKKIESLNEQHNAAIQKQNQELQEHNIAQWNTAMSTINSTFTSQISGLLKGTETFATAFRNMLGTILQDVIKFLVEWALNHAETIAMNVAGLTTETAVTTVNQDAQTATKAAGAAAQRALNALSIQGDAGRAAAGAYAAVAEVPIIGPALAPAAAAQAFAETMAFGTFEKGIYNLPQDTRAVLHQQEMVMPAAQANAFRSMLEGRGPAAAGGSGEVHNHTHVHFNVQANDSAGVKQFFRDNSHHILSAINHGVSSGSHLGLSKIGR